MQIQLPQDVLRIINRINEAGYEAYIVGGCVRDYLLGKEPNDWDITTSARPEEIKKMFSRTIDTGIQHGTVTVMLNHCGYEVTTYRIDGEYRDARHPEDVTFTASLQEDLKRRDFTINAMAYHPKDGLVDIFHGYEDLQSGTIRCVGNAADRFTEDALRMMRAIRFAAQLGYDIEEATLAAICLLAPNIHYVSCERIQTELVKLLVSSHPEKFRLFYETGLTKYFMPEFDEAMKTVQNNPHHRYTVGEHMLQSVCAIRCDKVLRLSMLLHDIAKPCCRTTDADGIDHFKGHPMQGEKMARSILQRLKFDNDTIRRVCVYVRNHDRKIEPTPGAMRRAICQVGEEYFPDLFDVKDADTLAQSSYCQEEKLAQTAELRKIYEDVRRESQCVSLKTLAVKGQDLIACGILPGRQIGEILHRMLEDVLDVPEHNNREYLLSRYLPAGQEE